MGQNTVRNHGGNYFWLGAYWECEKLPKAVAQSCTITNTGAHVVVQNVFSMPSLHHIFNTSTIPLPFALATVCIPASCDSSSFVPAIQDMLNSNQVPFQLLKFTSNDFNKVSVFCDSDPKESLSAGGIFVVVIIAGLAFVGIIASVLDEYYSYLKRVRHEKEQFFVQDRGDDENQYLIDRPAASNLNLLLYNV